MPRKSLMTQALENAQESDPIDDKEFEIIATDVFFRNQDSKKRIIINRGGAGSSKSYSICQLILYKFFNEQHKKFFICRKNLPALRQSCYFTLNQIASEYRVRDQIIEEKVHMNWYYGTNIIHFGGLDDPEKVKSTDWNYIWIEEATEFTYEDFKILNLRLRSPSKDGMKNQMYLSFNPIDEFHWIKTKLLDNSEYDVEEIHSTYKDNPFLEADAVHLLDNLEKQDPTFYNIYSLGNWGALENIIYKNWDITDWVPDQAACEKICYGLDFGYNDPTVLLRISIKGKDAYIEQLIHHVKLTSSELIQLMQSKIPFTEGAKKFPIYADPSRPEEIEDLKKAGFYVKPAVRSIVPGIDSVKRYRVHIMSDGLDTIKEFRSYSWKKDKRGNVIDEPVGALDHSCVSGETTIHTILGDIPIRDLVGKEGLVYCYDPELNKIVVKKFYAVRKTRKNADVVRVTLDDNSSVAMTLDHKVLLRTGEWCEAKDLQPAQSLMPFYQYYIKKKKRQGTDYLVLSCGNKDDKFSHRIVYENCVGPLPDDAFEFNVHHKDENGLNNDPKNLQLITRADHASLHKKGVKYSEEKRKRFACAIQEAEKHRSPEFLQKRNAAMKKANIAAKEWHDSKEGRKWHSEHWKKSLAKTVQEKVVNQCQRCGDDYQTSWTNKNRSVFCSVCGDIGYRELRKEKYGMTDGERRKLGLTQTEGSSPVIKDGGSCVICGRSFDVASNLVNRKKLCEDLDCQNAHRQETKKLKMGLKTNHKVVSVERVSNRDVYNMEVEGVHNFAANGVYLHNCDAARYAIHTATRGSQGMKVRWLG